MYITVLEYSLSTQFKVEEIARVQELFGYIIGSVIVLFDILLPNSLAIMLAKLKRRITLTLDSLYIVIDILEQKGRLIQFLYLSFYKFLLDLQRYSLLIFYINVKKAYRQLLDCCLRVIADYLYQNIYNLRRLGSLVGDIPQSDIDSKISFAIQYTCQYQFYHLEQGSVDPQEHSRIADLLETRFLFQVKALALIGHYSLTSRDKTACKYTTSLVQYLQLTK